MQWEYFKLRSSTNERRGQFDSINLERNLDDFGAQGWELVAVIVVDEQREFWFKRLKGASR